MSAYEGQVTPYFCDMNTTDTLSSADLMALEDAHGAELLPDARTLARADQDPDAGAVLELLAFVRTHGNDLCGNQVSDAPRHRRDIVP